VSRPSRSPRPADGARRARPRARVARVAGGLACAVAVGASAAEPADDACAPLDAPRTWVRLAASGERGVAPAPSARPRSGPDAPEPGAIVDLPALPAAGAEQQQGGEALLFLPKREDGSLADDFTLARGTRVVASYWSRVLCATVARLVGDPSAAPADLLDALPDDVAVVPNHVYTTAAAEVEPAPETSPQNGASSDPAPDASPDPYRGLQHGLDRLGVDAARPVSEGAGARVAVLDSAPQADHRDLRLELLAVPDGPDTAAAVHGSLSVGVIAAVSRNGFGMAGAAPRAHVVAIPVCTPHGSTASDRCGLFDLLRGLDVAWGARAQVLNLSLVGPANPLLERATARLDELGLVIVAAAGNEATAAPRYPAAYASVVGVGAVDREGRPDPRSNRGPSAEIRAPGVEVLSTVPGHAFAFGSGTSLAAAHVSGALAVLVGSGATPLEARTALFQASRVASPGAATPNLAPLCDALALLGRPCPAPAP